MKTIASVKVDTTTACQLNCHGCTAEGWRRNNPDYVLTLAQLKAFLDACRISEYRITRLIFSGGEPLLWKHLKAGAKAVKESGLVDYIEIWTNAMHAIPKNMPSLKLALKNIDLVRVSDFGTNHDHIERLRTIANVRTVNKREFWTRPDRSQPGTLPANCNCPHLELCGDKLYACALVLWNSEQDGTEIPTHMSTDAFRPWFLASLALERVTEMDMCRRCVGNLKVNKEKVVSQ